jgi:hypothetical protein
VGPPTVVVLQVGIESLLKLGDLRRQGSGVELIPEGPLHPLHVSIELGAFGRPVNLLAQAFGSFGLGLEAFFPKPPFPALVGGPASTRDWISGQSTLCFLKASTCLSFCKRAWTVGSPAPAPLSSWAFLAPLHTSRPTVVSCIRGDLPSPGVVPTFLLTRSRVCLAGFSACTRPHQRRQPVH